MNEQPPSKDLTIQDGLRILGGFAMWSSPDESQAELRAAARAVLHDRLSLIRQLEEMRVAAATAAFERAAAEPPAEPDELMQWVENWAQAYPLDVFPKPDLHKARDVLSAAGLSLDCISADAMRHVITRVRARLRAAQPPRDE